MLQMDYFGNWKLTKCFFLGSFVRPKEFTPWACKNSFLYPARVPWTHHLPDKGVYRSPEMLLFSCSIVFIFSINKTERSQIQRHMHDLAESPGVQEQKEISALRLYWGCSSQIQVQATWRSLLRVVPLLLQTKSPWVLQIGSSVQAQKGFQAPVRHRLEFSVIIILPLTLQWWY